MHDLYVLLGQAHDLLVYAPLVLELGLALLELRIALKVGLQSLGEHLGRHPGVDVDEIGALHRLLVGAYDLYASAAHTSLLIGELLHGHIRVKSFRAGDDQLETQLARHEHAGVGQPGRRVSRSIAPAEGDLGSLN